MTKKKDNVVHLGAKNTTKGKSFKERLVAIMQETREEIVPGHPDYEEGITDFKYQLEEVAATGEAKAFVATAENSIYYLKKMTKQLGLGYEPVEGGVWVSWYDDEEDDDGKEGA